MLNIVLGSNNKSKKEAIEMALKELDICEYIIESVAVDSHVSSKPINDETLIGAKNRNQELLKHCLENNISFDLLISIEGGYEQIDNSYFIVTYASVIDSERKEFIGKSQGLEISEKMFEWVKNGNSLNKVIEEILGNSDNKKHNGISGYLTDGYYFRSSFDSTSVVSALQSKFNRDKSFKILEKKLNDNSKI